MNKNSVIQFSGPDVLEKLRLVMTLLNILAVTEISCSLILAWEGEDGQR